MIVIMISAKQGSGKSALAKGLQRSLTKCAITRFSKPLYEMHDKILSTMNRYNYDIELDKTLLQILGDWARGIDSEVIVKCLLKDISRFRAAGMNFVIVDDLRYKREFSCVPSINIRLECDKEVRKARCSQWRENDTHSSETDLDDWVDKFDIVIDTGVSTKEETLNKVLELINGRIFEGARTQSNTEIYYRGDQEGLEEPV